MGIPFFVGVCNKEKKELELYSGEYIIPFFVDEPAAEKIKFKLCEPNDCKKNIYTMKDNEFTLKLPKLFTIDLKSDSPEFKVEIKRLSRACSTISRNITRRNNSEFIFLESFCNKIWFVQNKKLIKESIDKRLGKIFHELSRILATKKDIFNAIEIKKYNKIKNSLGDL